MTTPLLGAQRYGYKRWGGSRFDIAPQLVVNIPHFMLSLSNGGCAAAGIMFLMLATRSYPWRWGGLGQCGKIMGVAAHLKHVCCVIIRKVIEEKKLGCDPELHCFFERWHLGFPQLQCCVLWTPIFAMTLLFWDLVHIVHLARPQALLWTPL